MNKLLTQTQWNWLTSGVALGVTFLLAVLLVKPIGVSTQFVIFRRHRLEPVQQFRCASG